VGQRVEALARPAGNAEATLQGSSWVESQLDQHYRTVRVHLKMASAQLTSTYEYLLKGDIVDGECDELNVAKHENNVGRFYSHSPAAMSIFSSDHLSHHDQMKILRDHRRAF
jgi:hypothetical protein